MLKSPVVTQTEACTCRTQVTASQEIAFVDLQYITNAPSPTYTRSCGSAVAQMHKGVAPLTESQRADLKEMR